MLPTISAWRTHSTSPSLSLEPIVKMIPWYGHLAWGLPTLMTYSSLAPTDQIPLAIRTRIWFSLMETRFIFHVLHLVQTGSAIWVTLPIKTLTHQPIFMARRLLTKVSSVPAVHAIGNCRRKMVPSFVFQ